MTEENNTTKVCYDCRKCKSFAWCESPKQSFYACTGLKCNEYCSESAAEQKERLIKYLGEYNVCGEVEGCESCEYNSSRCCIHEAKADILLCKGVIVPPVRLGETIYILVTRRWKNNLPPRTFIKKSRLTFLNMERVLNDWGKTVFGTHSEAAKAWAEMDKKER